MVKKFMVVFVVCLFVVGIVASGAFAIDSKGKIQPKKKAILDEAAISAPTAIDVYGHLSGKYVDCSEITPERGTIRKHIKVGNTWRDYQSNSTIGRRMGVMYQNAFRHFVWSYMASETADRYVYGNCWNPWDDFWTGPSPIDGGTDRGSAYAYIQLMEYDPADSSRKEIPATSYHNYEGGWNTMLSIDDDECEGGWSRHWDVPDWVCGDATGGIWPRCKVMHVPFTEPNKGRDYFHIVVNEAATLYRIGWVRCYINASDQLITETYHNGYKIYTSEEGVLDAGPLVHPIALVDTICFIDPVVEVSPVSKKVAIVYTSAVEDDHAAETNGCDVYYVESPDNGNNWLGGAPFNKINVTNYPGGCTDIIERAFIDLGACYDYNDILHIAYITTYVPCPAGGSYYPQYAWVYHWDSQSQLSKMIQYHEETEDIHTQNEAGISKICISAKDPIYHPDEGTYLFCTWTQVDSADRSATGFGNRDIFACASTDGGASWAKVWNLTQTNTDQCLAGDCVSESWASLAQNMYNGDLHIQYICDRDAGPCVWDEGVWTDNEVWYLDLEEWEIGAVPRMSYRISDPPSPPNWNRPPLRVPEFGQTGDRVVKLTVYNIGNAPMNWAVTDDDPVCIVTPGAQTPLAAQDSQSVSIVVKESGCVGTFVDKNVIITTDDPDNPTTYLPIQAVVGVQAYYECPRTPETEDTVDNTLDDAQTGLIFYTNANCQEWYHYYDPVNDTTHEVGFQGGIFVATIKEGDTLVGRCMGDNDHKADAQESLFVVQCEMGWEPDYWLMFTEDIIINDLDPPSNDTWFCWVISKWIKVFKPTAPDPYRQIIIKHVKVEREEPPGWWPGGTEDCTDYEDTYIGIAMDIDCPYDSMGSQNGRNMAGYDAVNHIAYQTGWHNTPTHEYNDFYCGMALAEETDDTLAYQAIAPFGTYNVRNDSFLYPQSPWGWLDQELYDLAADGVPGAIQDPDTVYGLDRTQVFTAVEIPAGSDPEAEASFTLVEAVAPGGLAELQSLIDLGRYIVAKELNYEPGVFPSECGDVNDDDIIDLGDLLFMVSYLYKNGDAPDPLNLGDMNNDQIVDLGDVLYIVSYLYKGGDPPDCPMCPYVEL